PGVFGDRVLGAGEDVGRVVAHEVVEAPEVVAAVALVEPDELVEEGLGEVSVADAELGHAEIFREGTAGLELVPGGEQFTDELRDGAAVAGVAFPAGQCRLVFGAGGLLPQAEELPVQLVEAPDAAFPTRSPPFEVDPLALLSAVLFEGRLREGAEITAVGSSQVEGDLDVAGAGLVQHRPELDDVPEVVLVLDPVADDPVPGEVDGVVRGQAGQDRTERASQVDGPFAP